jgi:hypothetical protein
LLLLKLGVDFVGELHGTKSPVFIYYLTSMLYNSPKGKQYPKEERKKFKKNLVLPRN